VSVEKFLKQRAVNIAVGGSYTLANWYDRQGKPRTFACRTTRVSPFRMLVQVPVIGKIGSPITSFFSDFGKLQGVISDTTSGAFLLELEMTRSMREKFASKLTWLEKKLKDPRVSDVRKNARIIPPSPHSTLILATARLIVASSSTCRLPAPRYPLQCSRLLECRSPSVPASAGLSDFCPTASQSSSSKNKTATISTG
jgi:hypothetical protein